MKFFRLGYFEWGKIKPEVWIEKWAELFLTDKERREDDQVYESLIQKKGQLSAEDFEQIGRWKEGCLIKEPGKEHGRWNPRTPVAYGVWMEARGTLPPLLVHGNFDDNFAKKFLEDWSKRTHAMLGKGGKVRNVRFGLARASTLLHFISGGRFPIYDSLVWYALHRMGTPLPWEMTVNVDAYLKTFYPLFYSIASRCGLSNSPEDLRRLDNALRCYGRRERRTC